MELKRAEQRIIVTNVGLVASVAVLAVGALLAHAN